MKTIKIQWSKLTDSQREQVLSLYSEELKQKQVFEHDLYRKSYHINTFNGQLLNVN